MSFFGKPKSQAQQQPAYTGLSVQTSSYGKVVPLVYGTIRIAPNLIWFGDFQAISHTSSASGGKGGGSASSTSYTYSASVCLGLCEGPIVGFGNFWVDKAVYSVNGNQYGFDGSYDQEAWGYLTSVHPDQALNYRGIAYAAVASLDLGSSPNLSNYNYEVKGPYADTVVGKADADPSQVVSDFLSNPHHGAGFPLDRIGDLTQYQDYTLAAGLLVSFELSQQATASSILADLATATNSEFVWSEGVLTLVPFGDEELTGNGKTYTPPSEPLYDLTDDDFIAIDDDPVKLTRKRPSDAVNAIQLEYDNRSNSYATDMVEAKDQAAIDRYGLRTSAASSTHMFADPGAARTSVQLQLQRQSARNVYTFTTDERYILLDPMDIVTLTDPGLDLDRQWVRIIDITENDDRTLTFTAEEYLSGTGSAAAYSYSTGAGYSADYNADPGDANEPIIFDAPVELSASGIEVWMAVSGGENWGGADIHISTDGDTYKFVGTINGKSRQGILSSAIPATTDPDTLSTLSVDLTESAGTLLSGTKDDADHANTLCYVDGELVAYQTATLTATSKYDLTYLRRGLFGTAIASHALGASFARMDDSKFVYSYDKDQIGQTIYVKLASFNTVGGGKQSLADIDPYTYVVQGPPVPGNVRNFVVKQNGNSVNFSWSKVSDYALKGYDIGYAPQGSTDWGDFTMLTEAGSGTEMTNAAVPPGTWTFGIRARDIADQLSPDISTFDLVVLNNNDTTTVQKQEPGWAGDLHNFVRHWTGVLVPQSTTLADENSDWTVFDTFVPDPVSEAWYTTPVYDIGYENSLRIYSVNQFQAGPGESSGAAATTQIDAWSSGSDPDVYVPWTIGTIPVRYLKMRITYAPEAGSVAALTDFTYTVDRSPVIEQSQSVAIAPGGTAITFPQTFHEIPKVTATPVSDTAVYATAADITTAGCTIHIWNSAGTDIGGTANWKATGY
ncbi:MAG: hypothetical protein J0H19_18735 [Rhodospirillales bacterium]|nr:hypothetical protein [Rhodospirillales bacterium]MBN8928652.1 hypothetical protein [Rhodospirillales bacterium]